MATARNTAGQPPLPHPCATRKEEDAECALPLQASSPTLFDTRLPPLLNPLTQGYEVPLHLDFPNLPRIPRFEHDPLPPPFRPQIWQLAASTPTDLQLTHQKPFPEQYAVHSTNVSSLIRHKVYPTMFRHAADSELDDVFDSQAPLSHTPTIAMSVEEVPFNRFVLMQAMYGFSFQTAPLAFNALTTSWRFVKGALASDVLESLANDDGKQTLQSLPVATRGAHASAITNRLETLVHKAGQLYRAIVCLNLQTLANALSSRRVWTFALRLTSSPYFGQGGLHARVCFQAADGSLHSAHVQGLQNPLRDVPNLMTVLHALCPTFARKLFGVAANLSQQEHGGLQGAIVSRVVAQCARVVPRKPALCVPDDMADGMQKPPMFPWEVAELAPQHFLSLLNQYRVRLESVYDHAYIERMLAEHLRLHTQMDARVSSLDKDGRADWEAFERAWRPFEDSAGALFRFCGGLAAAFLYTGVKAPLVSITCLFGSGIDETESHVSTELILQSMQFLQMRELAMRELV